jgi:SAM-dependent methyltransferase
MTDAQVAGAAENADQIAFWNGEAGQKWVGMQARMDAWMVPFTEHTLEAANVAPGEAVLDIGCGCGATVLALAPRTGPAGHVLGVDVSAPMLGLAGRRVAEAGWKNITLQLADATTYAFEPASRDVAFSRFGVMFFADPVAAFTNIRAALRPGARLAFVCWRTLRENPFFAIPQRATAALLPAAPAPDPDAPGQFSFADPDRVRRILTEAGFSGIELAAKDPPMTAPSLDDAVERALELGPAGRALADVTPAQRAGASDGIRAAFAAYAGPDGVAMPAGVWIVTARA